MSTPNKLKFLLVCALGLFVTLAMVPRARGQSSTQGAIQGTITDPSGAVIPDAQVTVTNNATGFHMATTSDANGFYTFPLLPVGTYTVSVEKAGFSKFTQANVPVTVGARLTLDVKMPLGRVQSSVTVSAQAPILEPTKSAVSATVSSQSIANLPVNGRNFMDFVLLTPGVTSDVRTGDISFAGQRGTLNSLVVDGSDDNNTFFGQTLGRTGSGRAPYQFSQDAVQEFQVNSNGYSAEYGHAGAAVVNVVTKSGTNQFHGTAFEFYRDRGMNANDPIAKAQGRPKQPYHYNQFGGNLGGPILKDRAFFFFDYDGQRNTVANLVFLNLPANFVPSDANETAALNYLKSRAGSYNQGFNQNDYFGKVDWRLSSKQMLAARYNAQRFTGLNLENGGPQNSVEHTGNSDVTTDTLALMLTSTLSNTMINELRYNFTRDNEPGAANSNLPQATVHQNGITVLTAGRNFFSPRFTNIHRNAFDDVLTYIHGRHTFKTGFQFQHDSIGNFFPGNFSGQYTFNTLESFGANLNGAPAPAAGDNFVQAFAGSGTTGPTTYPNLTEYSGFGEDQWRVKPNFTLNLGLRYDFDQIAQPPTFNPNPQLAAAGIITNRINNQATEFGPRIGFAWTPMSNDRLVVRGGYGIFYARTPSITVGTAMSNNGLNVTTLTFTGSAIPAYPNTLCGAPTDSPSCSAPTGGNSSPPIVFGFQPNYKEPNVQQMSVSTEYAIRPDLALTVSYLHVKGTHLTRTLDINLQGQTPEQIGISGTSTALTYLAVSPLRPYSNFSRIEEFQSNANSNFNGLTVELQKRFAQNFQVLGSYTLGKVTDNGPDATSVVPFSFDDAKMVQDPLNVNLDHGPGNNDQRNRFVLSGIWDLNYANQMTSRVERAVLGGWEVSGIFTAQSGQPYSGLLGFDLNGDSNRNTDRTPGLGRNTFYLPATVTLNPRITRNVGLTEKLKLQFIAEAFNLFNRTNITGVNTTQYSVQSGSKCAAGTVLNPAGQCLVSQPLFGVPTSTTIDNGPGSRILQLAVKLQF
ncbi:MAG: TonB-dependent receptor [Acidobacteriota bacterium]|nr:TonB-dependent receptor [Acidobacteriota bacterium]